jgi:hypothetical protein
VSLVPTGPRTSRPPPPSRIQVPILYGFPTVSAATMGMATPRLAQSFVHRERPRWVAISYRSIIGMTDPAWLQLRPGALREWLALSHKHIQPLKTGGSSLFCSPTPLPRITWVSDLASPEQAALRGRCILTTLCCRRRLELPLA